MNPGDTCTPIYGLPYPTRSSNPCNIGDTLCDFATEVETELDRLDSIVGRTANTIPMVKVASTVSFLLTVASDDFPVPFDTVEVDTNNMFDGNAANTVITINQSGIYMFRSAVWSNSTGGGNPTALSPRIVLPTEGFTISQNFVTGISLFNGSGGTYPMTAGQQAFLQLGLNIQSTDTITVYRMELSAVWLGDLS